MSPEGWVAIAAIVTSLGGLWSGLTAKKKIDAETESLSVTTMKNVIEEQRGLNEDQKKVIAAQRKEIVECHEEREAVLSRLELLEQRQDRWREFVLLNFGHDLYEENGR